MKKNVTINILFIFIAIILFGCIKLGEEKLEQPKSEVTITTDKTEYERGETVNIIVRNDLNKSVWYLHFGCYPWWHLEVKKDGNWQAMDFMPPILTEFNKEACFYCLRPQTLEEVTFELKSGSEISDTWNLNNCRAPYGKFGDHTLRLIEPGSYRLTFNYSPNKKYDSGTEEIVYSKEFKLEIAESEQKTAESLELTPEELEKAKAIGLTQEEAKTAKSLGLKPEEFKEVSTKSYDAFIKSQPESLFEAFDDPKGLIDYLDYYRIYPEETKYYFELKDLKIKPGSKIIHAEFVPMSPRQYIIYLIENGEVKILIDKSKYYTGPIIKWNQ